MSTALQPDRFGFLHIDLNSFFASVEQQLHPEYRGRPLAVVPTKADTTCCIAASYEAKALGIKTGTQVGEAKRLCPDIILVAGNHDHYAEYSHKIAAAVGNGVVTSLKITGPAAPSWRKGRLHIAGRGPRDTYG